MGTINEFDFDAPQYLDLGSGNEKYFENKAGDLILEDRKESNSAKDNLGNSSNTENEDPLDENLLRQPVLPLSSNNARDLSPTNILLGKIDNLHIDSCKKDRKLRDPLRATQVFEGINLLPTPSKRHSMVTRKDSIIRTPKLCLRSRSITKLVETEEDTDESMYSAVSSSSFVSEEAYRPHFNGQLKRRNNETGSVVSTATQPAKYIGLSEMVAKFHSQTPDRFRTKPRQVWKPSQQSTIASCIPKTPRLTAIYRTRPSYFPDPETREQMEYEEMLKHQFKARPIKDKILHGISMGLKGPIEKRPTTKLEPFKLTEVAKSKPVEPESAFKFVAKPVPTRILQSPVGIPLKKKIAATTPYTPRITKSVRGTTFTPLTTKPVRATPLKVLNSMNHVDGATKRTDVEPFSFDARDKKFLAKKEENIRKIIEEEKKGFNSFRAHPMKAFPLEYKKITCSQVSLGTPSCEIKPTFKAKPASVLRKPVFCPKHEDTHKIQQVPFQLKTETRSLERKKFDEKLRGMETEALKDSEKRKELAAKKEKAEVQALRREMEFKANPIPACKTFEIHASDVPLTVAKSPLFHQTKK